MHCDLKEHLREWRRDTATEKRVPAYVIMPDATLEDLCSVKPSSLQQLRRISGFGDKRVEMYGAQILDTIRRFR